MTDEEVEKSLDTRIRKKIKEIILEVCRIEDYTDNKNFKFVETDSGEVEFHFIMAENEGRAAIQYSPHPYLERLLKGFYLKIAEKVYPTVSIPLFLRSCLKTHKGCNRRSIKRIIAI